MGNGQRLIMTFSALYYVLPTAIIVAEEVSRGGNVRYGASSTGWMD